MLSVPCDLEPKAVILDAPVDLQRTGPRERPLSHGGHMRHHYQTASMRTRLGYGSRGRFPSAVRKIPGQR